MFWTVALFVMIIVGITLNGVVDLIDYEEMGDEYETEYYIVYK